VRFALFTFEVARAMSACQKTLKLVAGQARTLLNPSRTALLNARHMSNAAAAGAVVRPTIALSARMSKKVTRGILENIDLLVCDMAGTTVQEGGLVYKTLQLSMKEYGLVVSDEEMEPWHGAKKESVIEHFARKHGTPENQLEEKIAKISDAFVKAIDEAYFDEASVIGPIDVGLIGYFKQLQQSGIKIALNTGYPQNIQQGLVKRLGFDKIVDGYISAYDVPEGRPYPFMIHRLMERLQIENVRRVAKAGDSVRDIEEGRNAGCGLVIGVLSGADNEAALMNAGADVIVPNLTDLPIPRNLRAEGKMRLPDLS